jgi:transposase
MTAGFKVVPNRWIVERSFAWCTRRRRLARDFERTTSASEAWMALAFQHTMIARYSA